MTESDCKEAKLTGGGMMMAGLVGVSGEDKGGGGGSPGGVLYRSMGKQGEGETGGARERSID